MLSIFQDKQMPVETQEKKIGIVRRLEDTFGFISDNQMDLFFHWSYMSKDSLKPFHRLRIGDRVYFVPVMKDNKPQAMEVSVVPFEKIRKLS